MTDTKGMIYIFPKKTIKDGRITLVEMQKAIDEAYANVIKNRENVNE